MCTLKNAGDTGKSACTIEPASKLLGAMLRIMQDAGYIGSFEFVEDGRGGQLKVQLTGKINRCGAITPRFSVQLDEMEYWEKQYLPGQELRTPDTFYLAWRDISRTGEKRGYRRRTAGVCLSKGAMMSAVRKVKIPDGVKAHLDGTQLRVTGPKGQLCTQHAVSPGERHLRW